MSLHLVQFALEHVADVVWRHRRFRPVCLL